MEATDNHQQLKNRIYIHLSIWIAYFALILFYKINNLGFDYAVKHTLVAGSISIALFYSYSNLVVNRYFEKKRYVLFAIFTVLTLVVFFWIKFGLETPYFKEFYDLAANQVPHKERRTIFLIIFASILTAFVITILENIIIRERKAQIQLSKYNEAQLMYLKAQINPHFLFNALNNIYSLSMVKSDKTPKMVLNLADLLRYSIYEGKKERVSVKDEIIHIKKYVDLFQSTQEKPVNIKFEVIGQVVDQEIEPMVLIPIVENCIKHGDFGTNLNAYVRIILEVRDAGLRFTTLNSMNKTNVQKDAVGGVGLENIKKRLQLKYPDRHTFSIMDSGDEFEVLLNIKNLNSQ